MEKEQVLFTGATASLRGSANFAGFAAIKICFTALAQSMLLKLSPTVFKFAHIINDGQINTLNKFKVRLLYLIRITLITLLFRSTWKEIDSFLISDAL
jgi:hypothetical protein